MRRACGRKLSELTALTALPSWWRIACKWTRVGHCGGTSTCARVRAHTHFACVRNASARFPRSHSCVLASFLTRARSSRPCSALSTNCALPAPHHISFSFRCYLRSTSRTLGAGLDLSPVPHLPCSLTRNGRSRSTDRCFGPTEALVQPLVAAVFHWPKPRRCAAPPDLRTRSEKCQNRREVGLDWWSRLRPHARTRRASAPAPHPGSEDHCQYKYLLHLAGNGGSARLKVFYNIGLLLRATAYCFFYSFTLSICALSLTFLPFPSSSTLSFLLRKSRQ